MKSTTVYITLCVVAMLTMIAPMQALADHSSGGGGCGGDCTPPTLGQDNSGRQFVENGFGINGKFFTVDHFQQDIMTQVVNVGDTTEVILRIYENEGPHRLTHASLMLGIKTDVVSGIQVESHPVQILWDKTFDGQTSFVVNSKENLVDDVQVNMKLIDDSFGNPDNITELKFSFIPLKVFDANPIVVKIWDYDRNIWTNYFYNSLDISNDKDSSNSSVQIGNTQIYDPSNNTLKIPTWFKSNAILWSQNQINDDTFVQGIKYCLDNNIMNIPNLPKYKPDGVFSFVDLDKGVQHYLDRYYNEPIYKEWFDANFPDYTIEQAVGLSNATTIPVWVKSNADLWANDVISDKDFVSGIEYLVESGIIFVS